MSQISPYNTSSLIFEPADGLYLLEAPPPAIVSGDNIRIHTVLTQEETLQSIAFKYYGDSGYWNIIAEFNDILNPLVEVFKGVRLKIPSL